MDAQNDLMYIQIISHKKSQCSNLTICTSNFATGNINTKDQGQLNIQQKITQNCGGSSNNGVKNSTPLNKQSSNNTSNSESNNTSNNSIFL